MPRGLGRLTNDPARDSYPAWAPDGRSIAFLRTASEGGSEVRLVPPIGGPERLVAKLDTGYTFGLAWAPDSRHLIVSDHASPSGIVSLFLLDIEGGTKEQLTWPSDPRSADSLAASSPDGRNLAFIRATPNAFELYVAPADGGEPRGLAPSWGMGHPAWLPDRDEIVFPGPVVPGANPGEPPVLLTQGGQSEENLLFVVPARGGRSRALPGTDGCLDVAVSWDGTRLACTTQTSRWDIWPLDLEQGGSGAETRKPLIASSRLDANPQFSPDGQRIAFTSGRSGQLEIWVANRDGSSLRQVTSLGQEGYVGSPRWSPDGRQIAFDFAARDSTLPNVFVVDASGGSPWPITTAASTDLTPSWSSDGRGVYFASDRSGEWQIWRAVLGEEENATAEQMTRGGGYAPRASPDGRYLYFARQRADLTGGVTSIWRMPAAGGDEEAVVESSRSGFGQWELTTRGLYFVDQEHSPTRIRWVVKFVGFDQTRPKEVVELERPLDFLGPSFSVSPDGRWALATLERRDADLMMAEGFR